MPRYIDADALFEKLLKTMDGLHAAAARHDGNDDHQGIWMAEGMETFLSDLNHYPTADVAPVVHGRWVGFETESWKSGKPIMKKYYRCYQCRKASVVRSNFCPYCGAKMDLEARNDKTNQ
ncbi:MAG: hypothetical protein RR385_09815 [Clostridiales bacterium]